MQKSLVSLLIAAGISMSPVAYAQDTATQEAPKVEEKAEAKKTEADATNVEDQVFPVAVEKSEIGQEFIADKFDDWQKVCVILEEGQAASCRLFQLLKDEGDAAVAEISIVALAKAEKAVAGVNFVTPLGTLLTARKYKGFPSVTQSKVTDNEKNSDKKGTKKRHDHK
ncbi:MAG: hypothetical protein COB84_05235, partial [Rhodobacteraceae bacterium]